jgi:predicted transcriptional regulator
MVVIKPKNLDMLAGTILNRRRSLNMTQKDLAEKSGISQAMVAMIESGGRIPHLMSFVSVLSALDMVLKMEVNEEIPA